MSSIKSINYGKTVEQLLIDKGLIEVGSSPTITSLSGGFWNDVYRVKTASLDIIVKSMQENTDISRFYPNQPEKEMEALKMLANTGIVPKFVAYFSDETIQGKNQTDVLIYEFSQGEMLTKELSKVDRKPLLSLVAELFAKQHAISVKSANFRKLATNPKEMIDIALHLLADLEGNKNIKTLQSFESILNSNQITIKSNSALVHTDAWAGNFIFNKTDNKLSLIDWQCPAIGDTSFDIWTFAFSGYNLLEGEKLFDRGEQDYFVDCYINKSGDGGFLERFEYFESYYSYQVAGHCCQRIVALSENNPQASMAYQQVFDLHIERLEQLHG